MIPTKRPRLVDDGSGGGAERAGGSDAVGSSVGSKEASSVGNQQRLQSSSLFALPLLSSKLGKQNLCLIMCYCYIVSYHFRFSSS